MRAKRLHTRPHRGTDDPAPARRACPPSRPSSWTCPRSCAPTTSSGPTRPIPPSASRSARRGTAAPRCGPRSTRRTSSPRPRRSAATARRRATPARCSSAGTRTRCRSRRGGPRSRCWWRTASTSGSTRRTGTRRRPRCRTRSSSPTAAGAAGLADGIVVTPSHNPPEDGGFKYNPPNGGPADTDVTRWIQDEANRILAASGSDGLDGIRRVPFERARARAGSYDFRGTYVADLANVIDMAAIAASGLRLGVDPLGGASVAYWGRIGERYGLDLTVTNEAGGPDVRVHDARLGRAHPDGPVLAVRDGPPGGAPRPVRHGARQRRGRRPARDRRARRRADEPQPRPRRGDLVPVRRRARVGERTWASARRSSRPRSSTASWRDLGRRLVEVPVGFKWFVDGLVDGTIGFGGEESAGASFLRRDGTVWTTDKDGLIADLLAAELTAQAGPQPVRGVRRADRPVRGAGLSADRRAGDARGQGGARSAVARGRHGHDARRRPDHRAADARPRQRRPDRGPQGRAPTRAGSPRGRPAPRT